jgi:hypothetical protein
MTMSVNITVQISLARRPHLPEAFINCATAKILGLVGKSQSHKPMNIDRRGGGRNSMQQIELNYYRTSVK